MQRKALEARIIGFSINEREFGMVRVEKEKELVSCAKRIKY